MVTALLLIIIYLAYISLGLPDGLLGVAWPEIRQVFSIPLAGAGYMTIVGTIGAVFSSFSSGHILKKIGTGPLVLISCLFTGFAILGFGLSQNFYFMVALNIPFGLGAGAVDAALNHYVAKNFTSRHMNWLHACWGIGAFTGPLIMTGAIVYTSTWRNGYFSVAAVQLTLAVIFLFSLSLWKKQEKLNKADINAPVPVNCGPENPPCVKKSFPRRISDGFMEIFTRKGLSSAMLTFFFYVGAEATVGLWSPTFFRTLRGVSVENAGIWVSMYYGCITIGRIVTGFFVEKTGIRVVLRGGSVISALGFVLLLIPIETTILCPVAMCLIGLGFAPMYPCVMQETPLRFGTFSQIAVGYQMGLANIGYTGLPILVALIADNTTLWLFPIFAFVFFICFIIFREKLGRVVAPVSPTTEKAQEVT